MMRLRRASVIAVLSSLAWAVTASAERPWILWSQGVRNKTAINWFTVGAYPSLNECRTALQEAAENLQNSGYELVDTVESITAIKDNDNFTGLTCFPDTVDPRGPKGSDGRRESPRRVLRRRTGCGGVVAGHASGCVRDRNDAAIDERHCKAESRCGEGRQQDLVAEILIAGVHRRHRRDDRRSALAGAADGRVTDARLWHPWLRINRVLRVMLQTRWSAEAWSHVRVEFKRALALRSEIRRAGWFN